MTIPKDTKYPKVLSNTYWQSKKSFKDKTKSATKTGLGDALTAAEKAWKAIPFDKLDATKQAPKTVAEAQQQLADAKNVKKTQVTAAIRALQAAQKKAKETSKNPALSDTARKAAVDMGQPFSTAILTTLSGITFTDFELAVGHLEAKAQGGTHLQKTSINEHNSSNELAFGPSAVRSGNSITVANLTWRPNAGDPQTHLKQTVTLHSLNPDNTKFTNDMVITKLSSDNKTATLTNLH